MAGIYIHIPFCRRICAYCDFYRIDDLSDKPQFIDSLMVELNNRKNYLAGEQIETIYFGGGTPSILTKAQLNKILAEIYRLFPVKPDAEITLEANPDDLKANYIKNLAETKINRLSIGIQSFIDQDLAKMGRRHNSKQAVISVKNAYQAGFKNIGIDLIYGLPGLSAGSWQNNLEQAFSLPVNHVSSYHLTYHKGTAFYGLREKGLLKEIPEGESIKQFEMLIDYAQQKGFIQYEISNFALERCFSKHNSAYWFGEKYLGVGPSAHSYDQQSRQWNTANVHNYIKTINSGIDYFEKEILSENDQYNDFILTNLRTMWGISKKEIKKKFGEDKYKHFTKNIGKYIQSGHVKEGAESFTLSTQGLFISDEIMASLMIVSG